MTSTPVFALSKVNYSELKLIIKCTLFKQQKYSNIKNIRQ